MKQVKFKEDGKIHGGIIDDKGNIICGCCGTIIPPKKRSQDFKLIKVYSHWVGLDEEILGDDFFDDEDINENDDLFGVQEGIVCQQVNCRNRMGAGLVKVIYEQFPIVKREYHKSFDDSSASELYGKYRIVPVTEGLSVANIYSQFDYGNSEKTGKVYTNGKKLVNAISLISKEFPDQNLYIPVKIGCGLAGGDWDMIKQQIKDLHNPNIYFIDTYTRMVEQSCSKVTNNKEVE